MTYENIRFVQSEKETVTFLKLLHEKNTKQRSHYVSHILLFEVWLELNPVVRSSSAKV